jgi:predicted  nucleic acid-binding Zn ribbon protein
MTSTGWLSAEQERYAAIKIDEFYESVRVSRMSKPDGYWLKCRECGKEWDLTMEMLPLYHWICPNKCNVKKRGKVFRV